MTVSTVKQLIQKAVDYHGTETKLGQATGYSQNAIWQALKKGRVSAEMAVAIDRATNGEVSKSALRPDLWTECCCAKEHA